MVWFQKRGNKYHAKSTIYNGTYYHSRKEAAYAMELDLRKKAGDIKDWKRQVKMDLRVNGLHITNYYVDFLEIHNDDSWHFIEIKGFETDLFVIKRRLLEATILREHPEYTYTVIK